MISNSALAGVAVIAVYLIGFALLVVLKPDSAVSFMRLFATSAKAHFTELVFRVGAGVVLIVAAPRLALGHIFESCFAMFMSPNKKWLPTIVPVIAFYLNWACA